MNTNYTFAAWINVKSGFEEVRFQKRKYSKSQLCVHYKCFKDDNFQMRAIRTEQQFLD